MNSTEVDNLPFQQQLTSFVELAVAKATGSPITTLFTIIFLILLYDQLSYQINKVQLLVPVSNFTLLLVHS